MICPARDDRNRQRGGHIPGAKSIPWAKTANDDGTFKTREELKSSTRTPAWISANPRSPIAASASDAATRGSSLKYLLGQNNVKNYDGSWTEWGNLVGAPIETGEGVKTAQADVRCQ